MTLDECLHDAEKSAQSYRTWPDDQFEDEEGASKLNDKGDSSDGLCAA